ncbi:uncharacterized protein isoform X2 [Rhodnius prolixus]|uniref:uncharacterized protein isoform X2 n=1 Tax=Rhodnius prolixus TaxID=13249 RepID=UPI003D187F79
MLIKYQLIFISVVLIVAEVRSEECNDNNCLLKKRSLGSRRLCFIGEVRYKDCNLCVCLGFGREHCTNYDCPDNQWSLQKLRTRRDTGEKKCKPGSVWKEDCNTCFCTETGHVGCTLMHCGPISSQQSRVKRGNKCTQGTTWKENGLTYFCNSTSQTVCTLMGCYPFQLQKQEKRNKRDLEKQCTPGTTWKEDCNTCFCSSTGQIGCTLMACHHYQLPTKQQRFKRDFEDEEQSEVSLQEETGKNCEIGTTVKLDCNICHCTAMGLACTRRLCHGQELSITVEE